MGNEASKCNPKEEIRLALLGKTGSGKSATGNAILGSSEFTSEASPTSVTSNCALRTAIRFGRRINICDTPGVFDTKESNEEIQREIWKCIYITSPGPHAFILVLNVDSRYTQEDQNTVDHFVKYFGKDIYQYLFIVFTRMDQLARKNTSLETYIQKSPLHLQELIKDCGDRVFAINNTLKGSKNDKQIESLLNLISENVSRNFGKCYTDESYRKAEEEIKREEEKRRQIIEEEVRRKKQEEEMEILKNETKDTKEKIKQLNEKMDKELEEKTSQIRHDVIGDIAKYGLQKAADFGYGLYEMAGNVFRGVLGR